jgi:hypothetical protein
MSSMKKALAAVGLSSVVVTFLINLIPDSELGWKFLITISP